MQWIGRGHIGQFLVPIEFSLFILLHIRKKNFLPQVWTPNFECGFIHLHETSNRNVRSIFAKRFWKLEKNGASLIRFCWGSPVDWCSVWSQYKRLSKLISSVVNNSLLRSFMLLFGDEAFQLPWSRDLNKLLSKIFRLTHVRMLTFLHVWFRSFLSLFILR